MKNRVSMLLIVFIIGVLVAVCGCTSDSNDSSPSLNVTNVKVASEEEQFLKVLLLKHIY